MSGTGATHLLRSSLVCCSLALTAWMVGAQTTEAMRADSELPSAPEPHLLLPTNETGEAQALDQNQQKPPKPPEQQPGNAPSLGDLGLTPEQTKPNPQLQAMLDKHTHMLKIHQRLGIITTFPMAAALITGPMAKSKGKNGQTVTEPTQTNLDLHAALGGATTALYFSTAYFAIFAPKIPGVERRGAIRFHRALAFVHGPGMIATPVLGIMAYKQEQAGEKVHGAASAHGTVAWVTAAAYGAAIVSVSWPIKVHF